MKKFFLLAVIGVLAASTAWGATITITANAAPILDVSVSTSAWTIALDNSGDAFTNDAQGAFTVKASKSAYTVTFSSGNNGVLKSTGADTIPYKIKVDTTGWSAGVNTNNLSSYTQLVTAKTITFKSKTPTGGKTFNIGFGIDAYSDYYIDGAYTDTLTITIAAP